ncbi:GNAT family N-acetyltransferase [Enterovibrio coralii]|uniref:N-acetyltransferase domain-containing protein n=1 Tax=Enterovibrio coralii TaxID=294935 RepID=A0A135I5N7_9GAMM|nr:GNAT family N-acetyltransferase [Enterovibrio coralii]KXF80751.1 hypothetical protein ATN88_15810 [Enterovibrio coralii]
MKFSLTTEPTTADIEEIRAHLIRFNDEKLNGVQEEPAAIFVTDDDGNKVAGITAEIWGKWLLIKLLWVNDTYRSHQLGKTLLVQMENHAMSKGCQKSLVETFSFQARSFYEKQGYVCQLTLDDYPVSTATHFLVKQL